MIVAKALAMLLASVAAVVLSTDNCICKPFVWSSCELFIKDIFSLHY